MKKNKKEIAILLTALLSLFIILEFFIKNSKDRFDRDKIIIVAQEQRLKSLDPLIQRGAAADIVFNQMYDTLVKYNEKDEVVGKISDKWEIINESEVIFHLKKKIFFSDGTELKAKDVKFSLERESSIGELLEIVEKIEILDDYTVKIKVKYVMETLFDALANIEASIISEEAYQNSKKIIGTGPYMIKEFSLENENNAILEINEYYLKKEYYKIEGIVFKCLQTEDKRAKRIKELSIDVVYNLSPRMKPEILKNKDLEWKDYKPLITLMLAFNNSDETLKNINLKKAIAYGIDQFSIISGVAKGSATYADSPVHEGIKGHSYELKDYQYNTNTAKEYMKKFNNGEKIEIPLIIPERETLLEVAKIIRDQLKVINIEVTIVELPFDEYVKAIKEKKKYMFLMNWFSKIPNIDYTLYNLFYSGSPNNYPAYVNKEIDEAFEKNVEGKIPYLRIQEIINEELPVIPIAYIDENVVYLKRIKNYKIDRLGNTRFFEMDLEPLNTK